MPALHILSTESKETIQHKLQNDYFMLRKHSKKAFAVVVFHSTEDQQKRQPSPLPSHTEPGGSPQPQPTEDLPEKSSCFSSRGPQEEGAGLTGAGGGNHSGYSHPGSQHPGIPSSGLHRAPKMPSFPNKAPSTTRGLHYVLVGHRTRLGFVSFLSTPRASISWSSQLLEELGRRS